jgi:hypothetical protein
MKSLIKWYGREKKLRYTGLDNRPHIAVSVSALCAGRTLHPGRFMIVISVRG